MNFILVRVGCGECKETIFPSILLKGQRPEELSEKLKAWI
jgi:hypothetical protein